MGQEQLTAYEKSFIKAARLGMSKTFKILMCIFTILGFLLIWHATRFPNDDEFILGVVLLFIAYPSLTLVFNHKVWLKIFDKMANS